jgi:oligosaccharide repeat unit polymerase
MSWKMLYAIDLLAIALFAVSYYRNCYRRGYRIDIWYSQLFLFCVLPNFLMLPFARSELNGIVLGNNLAAVIAVLPTVFLISLVGYFAMLAGGGLWSLRVGLGVREGAINVLSIVPRCSMMLMSSRGLLVFQTILCFLLQILILAFFFSQSGFGFDLRTFTFANPTLRPVAQTISYYSVFIASHCLARYVDKKEKSILACTLLLTVGLAFFGARASLLLIYMNVLLCYMVKLRSRISLIRISAIVTGMIAVGFYLGNVRAGHYSLADFFGAFIFLLFYGNNFSDLRDFAWVYSAWDHVFWAGKTYLAALTAFIPRFASEFRDTWGLGIATNTAIGLDSHVHPGVRPGTFGEGFFNFGLFGVVAVGLALGIIIRRVDIDVKHALGASRPSMMKAFASTELLSVAGAFSISAGISGLYVLCGVYLISWFCLRVLRMIQFREVSIADVE